MSGEKSVSAVVNFMTDEEKDFDTMVVTPWEVRGEIDYKKLVKKFGTTFLSSMSHTCSTSLMAAPRAARTKPGRSDRVLFGRDINANATINNNYNNNTVFV